MIEIDSIGRAVESNGDKTVVALTRTYDAEIADVWDALTDPERLSRWFLPIEGDLRVGGRYQLKGQAGGEILSCEPPHRFLVTWVFPPEPAQNNISEVEVRLREDGGKTVLELRHEAAVDPQMWNQFGPGAVGVGWDLCLLGLAMHLEHGGGVVNAEAFERSPEAREFITASSDAWGVANAKFGTPPGEVAAQVAATTAFYAPPPRESAPQESAPQG